MILERTFAGEIGVEGEKAVAIIKKAIEDAYARNKLRFDPSMHDRSMNYGMNNYTAIVGFIKERFAREMPTARVTTFDNVLQVEISGKKIRFAKLGKTETDDLDPKEFFGRPHRDEIAQETELRILFGQDSTGDWRIAPEPQEETVYILVGHFGDERGGLRKITAGAVRRSESGDYPWIWKEDIFLAADDVEQPEPLPLVSSTPADVPSIGDGAPRLRLVMRSDAEEEGETS